MLRALYAVVVGPVVVFVLIPPNLDINVCRAAEAYCNLAIRGSIDLHCLHPSITHVGLPLIHATCSTIGSQEILSLHQFRTDVGKMPPAEFPIGIRFVEVTAVVCELDAGAHLES